MLNTSLHNRMKCTKCKRLVFLVIVDVIMIYKNWTKLKTCMLAAANNCLRWENFQTYMCMHSDKTGDRSHRPILKYSPLKLIKEWKITPLSIVRFLVLLHTLICFLSPLCNFWLIFKNFLRKNPAFSAACYIQNLKGRFLQMTLPEKWLTVLHTNGRISRSKRSMNLILGSLNVCSLQCYQTLFTQNVNCFLFYGSTSHLYQKGGAILKIYLLQRESIISDHRGKGEHFNIWRCTM